MTDEPQGSDIDVVPAVAEAGPNRITRILAALDHPLAVGFLATIGVLGALVLGSAIGSISTILVYIVLAMFLALGLDPPTAGSVTIGGRRYRALRAPLREVGSLLDAGAVHPGRRARDHLRWLAVSNGIDGERVDEVLEIVGLAAVGHRRVGGFSLGMRQRLGIAAALLGDPPVLVLDEPVNGLDTEGIRWVRGLLRQHAAEGRDGVRLHPLVIDEDLAGLEPGIDPAGRPGSNRLWAHLMQRTFGFDVLQCPRCGGRLRLLAVIDQEAVRQFGSQGGGLSDMLAAVAVLSATQRDNVTIFGESAGSWSVCYLVGSPLAAGLFDRAWADVAPLLLGGRTAPGPPGASTAATAWCSTSAPPRATRTTTDRGRPGHGRRGGGPGGRGGAVRGGGPDRPGRPAGRPRIWPA